MIRNATAQDLITIDGALPKMTTRAQVMEQDGEVIAIWGIYPLNTRYFMFSSLTDKFRANKRAVVQGIKAVKALIASRPNLPVLAIADPSVEGSTVLLEHMGFERHHGDLFQWTK